MNRQSQRGGDNSNQFQHLGDVYRESGIASPLSGDDLPVVDDEMWGEIRLDWCVANHNEVQEHVTKLLTSGQRRQVIRIVGPSNSGKSRLSREILKSTNQSEWLRAGLLDLKGSAGLAAQSLATSLLMSLPPALIEAAIAQQLTSILDALHIDPKPTLLVFDTYEHGGAAADWIAEVLLPRVCRLPWVRVVICGQAVPRRAGTVWEHVADEPVQLERPTADSWIELHEQAPKPGVDHDFIRQLHELCEGNPTTLADAVLERVN